MTYPSVQGEVVSKADGRYLMPSRHRKELNLDGRSPYSLRFPHLEAGDQLGIARFMKPSNMGTVKAVSPCAGLHIMPFLIRPLLSGPIRSTLVPRVSAMAPERWGPGPRSAIALR